MNKITHVICEGKSEFSYIQELNRYFRENSIGHVFIPKDAGSGTSIAVDKAYREIRKAERKATIVILIDEDIYFRSPDMKVKDSYRSVCYFNHWNFEDFLVLHCDYRVLQKWIEACVGVNHTRQPLHGDELISLLRQHVFADYKKGQLPPLLSTITEACLDNLFRHHRDPAIPFFAKFAEFIEEKILPSPA